MKIRSRLIYFIIDAFYNNFMLSALMTLTFFIPLSSSKNLRKSESNETDHFECFSIILKILSKKFKMVGLIALRLFQIF